MYGQQGFIAVWDSNIDNCNSDNSTMQCVGWLKTTHPGDIDLGILVNKCQLLPTKLKKILKCPQKVVKCVYDTYINEMKSFPEKTYQKWKMKLNIDISKNDFLNLFSTMYACTKSTKLRDFQYRVLHSTLVTNDKLSMWGIINDESCSFCHNAPETIIHLLIECETSKKLWSEVTGYLYDISGMRINMSYVDVLLGMVGAGDTDLLNLINITVKQYLYACRCNNTFPIIATAIMKIKDICDIEKSIALKNNTLAQHNKKWQLLSPQT